VAGSTGYDASGNEDYATVALDPDTGSVLWEARFDDPPGSDAADPIRLAVSPDGSEVFVTGSTGPFGSSWEFGTVAYDAATGTQLWDAFYEGPGLSNNPQAIAISPDGTEVFVTGSSYPWDYVTIAYSTSG
jgi:outer membrane protein assembly factor BamB